MDPVHEPQVREAIARGLHEVWVGRFVERELREGEAHGFVATLAAARSKLSKGAPERFADELAWLSIACARFVEELKRAETEFEALSWEETWWAGTCVLHAALVALRSRTADESPPTVAACVRAFAVEFGEGRTYVAWNAWQLSLARNLAGRTPKTEARERLLAEAKEELTRIRDVYAPGVLGFDPLEGSPFATYLDVEGVRCIWTSWAFGDRGFAREVSEDERAIVFTPCVATGHGASRVRATKIMALRRAVAVGYDPRFGAPAYLCPSRAKPDDGSANLSRFAAALFGKGAMHAPSDGATTSLPKLMDHVFAHCDAPSTSPPVMTAEEDAQLRLYDPIERVWRLALLRATGSVSPSASSHAAYHEFRRLWAACHSDERSLPRELRAEFGGPACDVLLVERRASTGSLALEFLHAPLQDLDGYDACAARLASVANEHALWDVWHRSKEAGRVVV